MTSSYTTADPDEIYMYPGTCYPTWDEVYSDWEEFKQAVDYVPGLNQVLSWVTHCYACYKMRNQSSMMDEDQPHTFEVYIHSPRKSTNGKFTFTVERGREFPHAEVDAWIESYLKPRILQWYGFENLVEPQVWQAFINR